MGFSRIPMKRWGTSEDMAGLYVSLASDAASYITGQLFPGRRRLAG